MHGSLCRRSSWKRCGYTRALEDAGFHVVLRYDIAEALRELLGRIKRNLVGTALAAAAGSPRTSLKIDVKQGRSLLREAENAISAGTLGYGVLIGERPV